MGAVGLPGQVSFLGAVGPICLAIGVPLEPLALFIAVDTVPDIFRTVANVTGDMTAVTIIAHRSRRETDAGREAEPPAVGDSATQRGSSEPDIINEMQLTRSAPALSRGPRS